MNFGRSTPAAHGVMRPGVLEMDGEVIERADPHIGFPPLPAPRTEKLIDTTYLQGDHLFRLGSIVSPMCPRKHAFALAVEEADGIEPRRARNTFRVLFAEITRILNSSLNISLRLPRLMSARSRRSSGLCEEPRRLMEFYERASGARLHANYFRPAACIWDLPAGLADASWSSVDTLPDDGRRTSALLTDNRIFKQRTSYRHRQRQAGRRLGVLRRMLRGSGWPGISPGRNPTRLRQDHFDLRSGATATATTAI